MRHLRAIPIVLAATLAGLALASCGGGDDELLPGETASEIRENLDQVQELVDAGDCVDAEEATAEVLEQVEEAQIDPRLEEALEDGIALLSSLVLACEEEGEADETTAVEPAEEPETEEERDKQGRGKQEGEAEELEPGNQGNGKGKGPEKVEPEEETEPPAEPETPSGGLGPGEPAEEGQ